MKFLVCISKVPDTTARIAFTDNNTKFATEGVQYIMNPTDEWYALVRAIELKEALGGTVTVINVGGADEETIIRKALAIGADDAVRIDAEPADSYFVAGQIAEYAKSQGFDLIFTGKETIDYNGSCVGAMIAEFLDLPFVSLVSRLELNGATASMDREIEGGTEVLEVTGPLVVSCQKGLAEQRIPNMRGIMTARTKPLQVLPPVASIAPLTAISLYEPPKGRGNVHLISPDNVEELVDLLHREAKLI
jgi:electron transfer flavoprotein beta subunit